MDSIWEVMDWVIALRIRGRNKSATKNMKRGPVKRRSHDAQLQILFSYPRDLLGPLSFLWFIPLAIGPYCWLFLIGLYKNNMLLLRRGRVLPFQLSVGLTLSYSVKPPQPGSLVGPVRPLKIWSLSQCCLWSLWIVYGKRWLMKQFLLFPYLSQVWDPYSRPTSKGINWMALFDHICAARGM